MTDATKTPNLDLVRRFAELVALVAEQPSAAAEQRELARGVVKAAKQGSVRFEVSEGGLLVDGVPLDSPLLAGRLTAYGVAELGITGRVSLADLLDLSRLLASAPSDADPPARFAARAAVLDSQAIPRRLRPRAADATAPAPLMVPPRARPTPRASAAVRAAAVAPEPVQEVPNSRDEPERLAQALPVPTPSNPVVVAAIDALELAATQPQLVSALDQLYLVADLAFRQGRHDDLIEAVTALVALEYRQLERDGADPRRQAFIHALRRLGKPVLLRQLAVLRHLRSADAVASERLQQVLHRYGTDGAEALVDEYVSAPTQEARATCLQALRGLRRTHDALHALARDTRDMVVRHAAAILGDLRDARGEAILIELLQHPDARTRRAAVASLGLFEGTSAFDALAFALGDESPLVRLRAVVALSGRRTPRVLAILAPLIEKEPEREVLFSAISAVGAVGSAEAVQQLIRLAEGESSNPLRTSAAMRIQACTALVAIRTPTAMAAVQVLRGDRDREVREAAVRLVAQAQRRTTTITAVVNAP